MLAFGHNLEYWLVVTLELNFVSNTLWQIKDTMIQAVLVGPSTDCVLRGEAHMGEGKLLDVAATKPYVFDKEQIFITSRRMVRPIFYVTT